ncbi:gluconate:H+ symporter (GntP) family transporter [Listeria fleischmannii 1991]|jgi:GntP family gluconate:H+ symporter|uniref:Gnt-I system n=4 Tax=Listeria fleischmannii TaxID=1069827 RepID=A0A2X3JG70_9LIST|nr:gluconate:H+ symporter [Listeria fleischmannii]EIA21164.1 gluconate:H+ symporter (GntP) family transporter [Listeria fleischmannii subsp. coloradonensis]EMG28190.1 gluconate:H+ symporter (GntP) family transporter [Listeria fleischmannii subsp. fleischmannii LU2006-1]EUJ51861.1 gluconate:H+ symporter (GntP) family transporter [Listeria fleischmannii FSL S10-1203]KMT58955.1 gluconate:H+ symporter (GntP) family transporter [Listeria fleischmannii 1991]MBC1397899.1 2-keto-3-deoxygluconate perme
MQDIYLFSITIIAILIVILGVSWWKWHAYLSLSVATIFLAIFAGMPWGKIAGAFETGVGAVLGHLVGILALGTILGKMMSTSGAGMQIANFFIEKFGIKRLPWAMFFSGLIIGIPVFFEVGLVILLPIVLSIQKTVKKNILLLGLPVLAGLSIAHGIIPPHPGAMTAISIYNANVSQVLLYAICFALPAGIIAGPLYAKFISKRITPEHEPTLIRPDTIKDNERLPSVGISFFIVFLPIILMLLTMIAALFTLPTEITNVIEFIGNPLIALLISVFVAYYFLGFRLGLKADIIRDLTDESMKPLASIILIIGAGGAFKQILIDTGVATAIANLSSQMHLSPIVMSFCVAGLIRVATGSATVALTTAAGIVAPIVESMTGVNTALLVIATGAGSLMLSHVNDAGFWLVKEYLGLTVKETFKTWTVLETLLSFSVFFMVLIVDIFV